MSNLAKDDDIFRMIDDCGEQSMLTVCSLIFLVLSTLRVQNFARRNVREFWAHLRKFIQAKKTEIYDSGKLIHAKKTSFFNSQKFIHYRKTPKLVITVLPVIHLFIKNV